MAKPTLAEIVKETEGKFQCNCDLDNWEPEKNTGHSHVCRIHNISMEKYLRPAKGANNG
jgi:hypothetical protein